MPGLDPRQNGWSSRSSAEPGYGRLLKEICRPPSPQSDIEGSPERGPPSLRTNTMPLSVATVELEDRQGNHVVDMPPHQQYSGPHGLPGHLARAGSSRRTLAAAACSTLGLRLALAAMGSLLLALVAILAWYLTSTAAVDSVEHVSRNLRNKILGHVAQSCASVISATYTGVTAYSTLLMPSANAEQGGFESFASQVRPATFVAYKVLGNQSIVSIARSDGTFLSFYASKDGQSDVFGFDNRSSVWDGSVPPDLFEAPANPSTGAPQGPVSSVNSAASAKGRVARGEGTPIGTFPDGRWRLAVGTSLDLVASRDVTGGRSGARWGTAFVSTSLSSLSRSLQQAGLDDAVAYVTTVDGYLVASSDGSDVTTLAAGSFPALLSARQSPNPVIRASAAKLLEAGPLSLAAPTELQARGDGRQYWVNGVLIAQDGLTLVVVTVFPESAVYGGLGHGNRWAPAILAVISCGIFTLGLLLILGYSRWARQECWQKQRSEGLKRDQRSSLRRRFGGELGGDDKAQFMANMSHELRTPMAGIIGLMDILQCDETLTLEQTEIVYQIRRCAMALLGILNNILDLSKVEEGKLELEAVGFDPTSELESLVEMFAVHCATAGVDIGLDLADDMPQQVVGDCARFRQIFANLLSNSIKFTAAGWIWIRGGVRRPGDSGAQALDHGRTGKDSIVVYFEIEDSGLGIDPSKWDSVFETFVQEDASSTRKHGGAGLGLSLVRAFVEAMDGQISILPKVGVGTRIGFHLVLRRTDGSRSAASTPDQLGPLRSFGASIPAQLRQARILLSMPQGINLNIVEDWLARKGLAAQRSLSWADTVLSVEEWARGEGRGGARRKAQVGPGGTKGGGEGLEDRLLVLVDLALLPGMNKSPPDMAEVKAYLARLQHFHERGADVACLLSPSTPIAVRNELRDSLFAFVANKPLYASKLWRLLLCMMDACQVDEFDNGDRARTPLQSLKQDMLVAQGTGVHLAVEAARLDLGTVHVPAWAKEEGASRQEGLGGGIMAGGGGAGSEHGANGLLGLTHSRLLTPGLSHRFSGDLHLVSQEVRFMGPSWSEAHLGSGRRMDLASSQSARYEQSGKLANLKFGPGSLGGQALLASGIEHGAGIASMRIGGLPDTLAEPYDVAEIGKFASPKRPNSLPLTRAGSEKEALQAWVEEQKAAAIFHSEPTLRGRPDLFPPLETATSAPPLDCSPPAGPGNSSPLSPFTKAGTLPGKKAASPATPTGIPPRTPPQSSLPAGQQPPISPSQAPLSTGPAGPELPQSPAGSGRLPGSAALSLAVPSPRGQSQASLWPAWNHNSTVTEHADEGPSSLASRQGVSSHKPTLKPVEHRSPETQPLLSRQPRTGQHALPTALAAALQHKVESGEIPTHQLLEPTAGAPVDPPQGQRTPLSEKTAEARANSLSNNRSPGADAESASGRASPDMAGASQPSGSAGGSGSQARRGAPRSPVHPLGAEGPLAGMHILVAEDTPILRRLAVTLLEKLGAAVRAVNDGQAALEVVLEAERGLSEDPIDAVIMDCQMPRLDGYSATEGIRLAEKETGLHMPIIALTAHAMASDQERCLACGMDAYLTKPANKALLVETLQKFVKVDRT